MSCANDVGTINGAYAKLQTDQLNIGNETSQMLGYLAGKEKNLLGVSFGS